MPQIVILGAGIIGVSTAYYLSLTQQPGSTIHLVEPSQELFASASGFAGGFLAADWFAEDVSALGKLSFEEHARLAREFGGAERWGYRRGTAVSYSTARGANGKRGDDWLRQGTSRAEAAAVGSGVIDDGQEGVPKWIARWDGDSVDVISEVGSSAQVDPRLLCHFLLQSCLERGVQLHHPAQAVSVANDDEGELSSIRILNTRTKIESDLPCTSVLIAAGAWSPQVFSSLFPASKKILPLSSLAGHSLVIRSPSWRDDKEANSHAVFATEEESGYCPEIFSRAFGEIYVAGLNSSTIPLPALPGETRVDEDAIEILEKTAQRILVTKKASDLEIVRKGLCFRPVTARGTPILGRISDEDLGGIKTKGDGQGGVWLASGHGPWGISMSLGTGKVMAEMMQGQPTSASVDRLALKTEPKTQYSVV